MKTKISRRIFALLLTVAMILTLVPTAFADTGFIDVPEGSWYAEAVKWAVAQDPQITGGIGDGKFGPNNTCTRAQVMLFLYAYAKKPAVTGTSPFSDVKSGAWYHDAVLWAVAQEPAITGGIGDGKFGPNKTCTRAQVMMFLWAYAGKPAPKTTNNPFSDVKQGAYYYDAVLWAVENGITGGVGNGKFGSNNKCTRAQVMTFLYKFSQVDEQPPQPGSDDFVLSKELKDGDEVVIYNAGHKLAIKNETDNDWYLMGSEVTIDEENHKVVDPAADVVWKVAKDANGMTRFTNGDNAITCWVSENNGKTYYELTNNADYEGGMTDWALVEADAATYSYYIKSWNLVGQYGGIWLEFYYNANKDTTKLSAYNTSDDRLGLENFGFQFYVKGATYEEPATPPPAEGDYVLTTELKTGDELVLFNAGNGMAVTAEMAGYNVKGTAVTPADHKIANPAAGIVWTATVNDDGSVTLRNGNSVLAAGQSPKDGGGYYNNLYLEEGENAIKWTRTVCNAENMSYTLTANGLEAQYGGIYLEWYGAKSAFSAYDTSADRATEANFGFQFYVKGAEYVEPGPGPGPEPGEDQIFVKLTAEPEDWAGTYVIARAKDETTAYVFDGQNDKNENFVEAPLDGDKITASSANAIVIEKSGDGYTFKASAGYINGKTYQDAPSNGLVFETEPAVGTLAWTDGLPVLTSAAGTVFRFNNKTYTDASYLWFRFFKTDSSVTTDANTYIELYKLDESLAPTVNKAALRAAIAAAKALEADKYTEESYAAVTEALAAAEAVLAKEDATQEEIDAAAKALNDAIAALVEKPIEGEEYTLTTELKTGDLVVIYSPAATKAVDSTLLAKYYLTPTDVTLQGDKIINPAETVVWQVTVNEDGTYTFDQGEFTLVAYASGNYVDLGNTTGEGMDPAWVLTAKDEAAKTFTIKSATVLKGEQPVYLEWYAAKTEFSAYGSNNPTGDEFGFQFYSREGGEIVPTIKTAALEKAIADAKALDADKYTEESFAAVTEALAAAEAVLAKEDKTQEEVDAAAKALNDAIAALEKLPVEPVEGEFVLTNAIKDGDQVIIYHPTSGMAVSNADLSESQTNYRAGVAVTPEDGKIADPADAIVWTVSEAGGGFIFTDADGKQLACTGNNLLLGTENTVWEIRAGGVEGTVNLVNTNAPAGSGGDPRALEWYAKYSEFSCYYLTATDEAFALQLFVKTEGTEPVEKDLEGKIVILHTNDTHGAIMGFSNVAGLKAEYEKRGATVLLVDAGDFSQGTTYVSTNKGAAAVTLLNAAGYDYVTLGNHEFDFGYAQLKSNLEKAEFEVLCADVLLKETGASAFRTRAIKEIDGFKIGFFGMETPETFTKVNPGLITEITFPQGEAMYKCAQDEVDWLKEEGADIIIGIVHLGVDAESEPNRSIDLYNHVEGIDFLIDGHSHTVMTEGPNGEPIQSTGTKADKTTFMNVGYIEIDPTATRKDGRIKNELIAVDENTPKDETVAAAAQEIMDAVDAEYGAKFATSEVELNGDKAPGNRNMETNLGDLITDSMLWGVLKDMDAETLGVPEENVVAITNGGGIRAWIHAGDVTKNDVNTVLPFGNTIAVVYVTGAELLEALEASTYSTPGAVGGFPQVAGMKFTIDTAKEYDKGEQYPDSTYYRPASIKRVTIDEINGKPFDPKAKYAVVTNNFCAAGGDTYYAFKAASSQFDTGIPLDEMLINYITEKLGGVIGSDYAEPQGRITILEDLSGKTIILHTNDTHGALMGFAQVAAKAAFYEKQGATVLLVDAGDFSQGTTYVSTNKGEAAVTVMNAAGYDVATLGNHEFDFGYAQLMANLDKAEFDALCADVFVKATGESILPATVIKEVNGVKIGFFGMETPETQTKVNPGLITEISFGTNENGKFVQSAKDAVAALKADGADVIIGLVHLGVDAESEPYRSVDLYAEIAEDVDFLIDGHSHTVMTAGPNGEPIQSTGTKASKTAFMNVGLIQIDNETKKIEKSELIPLGEDAPVDETVAAVAQGIMDAVDAEYGAKFATSEVELNGDKAPGNRNMETNLGDLITDSMRWSVLKDMDAETLGVPEENVIAITNGGGIRAWIHAGDVTKNDVNTVLPFGNTVAVVYVTGAELLEALEASTYSTPGAVGGFPQVSGMKFNIDTAKAFAQGDLYPGSTYHAPASIQRVTIDEIGGKPFDPEAKYAVVTNNFCAAGGDTYFVFQNASAQFDTGIPMDEALIAYITDELGGVIKAPYDAPQGRITQEERVAPAVSVEATFPSTSNDDIAKYGNVYTNLTVADLNTAGIAYGDIVTVAFLDKSLDVPFVPTFSYVDQGTPGLFKDSKTDRVLVAINMGDFATTYGLATKTTNEDKTYFWTAVDGVEFPVPVTITMKEQGGYATEMAIRDINRTNNREDYPDLTDAEFANFREVTTTGMGEKTLYRGSNPIDPQLGRNTYADAELEKAGVTVIMNLANDQASAEAFEGFADTYYSKQNIIYLNLGVDFAAADFQSGLATGLKHFAANKGVYYVHCTEGKDRAGFVSALLECLMGATYDEVVADYLKTYTNYYTVVDGQQQALSDETLAAIANSNIIKTLQSAFGVEDLKTADLAAEAAEYIKEIGLSDEEIATLKANLAGTPAEPEYVYYHGMTVADGDEVVIVHHTTNTALSKNDLSETYPQYRAGVAVTPENGIIEEPAEELIWTVAAAEGGYYLEDAEGNKLSIDTSAGRNLKFGGDADVWEIRNAATEGSVYIASTTAKGSGGDALGIEWYAKYTEFTVYYLSATMTESDFALDLYVKTDKSTIHEHEWVAGTVDPADCTHQEVTHYTCSVCGEEKTEVTAEALGHDFGEYTVTTAATCTAKGEETATCSRCGTTDTREIAMIDHVDANEDGKCDVCGADLGAVPTESYYVKVTANADMTEGKYLIVYEEGNLACDGSLADKLDAIGNSKAVTIEDGKISAEGVDFYFEFNGTDTFTSASGLNLGQDTDANGLNGKGTVTVSFNEDGSVNIIGAGGTYLRYNAASNQTRFRFYKAATYTNQKPIAIYKLVEG